jgi:site-specific DNA-methyltransferase (adenine-specific)
MSTRVLVGDALSELKTLPASSCHVCVTSPPYFQLRDYGVAGQIGLERTPDEYVQKLVEVFREVWRVLRPDATLWLNIGDSMAGSGKGKTGANGIGDQEQRQGFHDNYHLERDNQTRARWPDYGKPKDLLLIPFRLAIALQSDGWYVRSDIAWCKKSCMPESVQDRPTAAWEHVFLLSKQRTYYYDAEAVRETASENTHSRGNGIGPKGEATAFGQGIRANGDFGRAVHEVLPDRNMRNFWVLGPEPFPSAHFATFVPEIPRRAILAGSPTGGLVLDPFAGAGTTGLVADRLGRDSILIELNPAYAEMARQRIAGDSPMFTVLSVPERIKQMDFIA